MKDLLVVLGGEVPSGRSVAEKIRAEHYSCVLMPSSTKADVVMQEEPAGIIIAAEMEEGVAALDAALLKTGVPLLALGSCANVLLQYIGKKEEQEPIVQKVAPVTYENVLLFEDLGKGERWIKIADNFALPEAYTPIAHSDEHILAYANQQMHMYFLQFQIERNDLDGMAILISFASNICGCTPWWTVESMIAKSEEKIREAAGDRPVVCAMSGGLDSTVAAVLARRVLGDKVRCLFVDTGLMREGEADAIEQYFKEDLGLRFVKIDASQRIMVALEGVVSPYEKRDIVEREIGRALLENTDQAPGSAVFIKGTHYLDMMDTSFSKMEVLGEVIMPLGDLFKYEIRLIGEYLQLSAHVINRQPFPGVGLASRIRGLVTKEALAILRKTDAIFEQELKEAGLLKKTKRYFSILDRMEDGGYIVVLRATQGTEMWMHAARLPYDVLERTIAQIQQEIKSVERALYDMTPGIAEWVL